MQKRRLIHIILVVKYVKRVNLRKIMALGYIAAIITSLFFTAYVVPKKLSKLGADHYSVFQGLGYFLGSAAAFIISRFAGHPEKDTFNNEILWYALLTGVLWFAGSAFFLAAIDRLGLSRSNQWKNLQGPCGAILNLLFLAEYNQTNVPLVLIASGCILASAFLFNIKNGEKTKNDKLGIILALMSAVIFGFTSMLQKKITSAGAFFTELVVISGTVFVVSVIYLLIKERSIVFFKDAVQKDGLLGILGGILYFGAAYFTTVAYSLIPGSVAFTIIQLNTVWTVLVGIIIFREISFRENKLRIIIGLLAAITGIILLLLA